MYIHLFYRQAAALTRVCRWNDGWLFLFCHGNRVTSREDVNSMAYNDNISPFFHFHFLVFIYTNMITLSNHHHHQPPTTNPSHPPSPSPSPSPHCSRNCLTRYPVAHPKSLSTPLNNSTTTLRSPTSVKHCPATNNGCSAKILTAASGRARHSPRIWRLW